MHIFKIQFLSIVFDNFCRISIYKTFRNKYLDFEKNVAELESKVSELRQLTPSDEDISIDENIKQLEQKANMALEKLYSTLSPWQKTKVARHPDRPHFRDYLEALFEDFIE